VKWSDALKGGAYFTRVPKGIAKMPGGPLRLYIQLLEMMHSDSGEVWWSHKEIAKAAGMSERNVRKMAAELKELGYIDTKRASGRACGVHTIVLVRQEHLDLGTNVPRKKRSGKTGTNVPPKADRTKRSPNEEEKKEERKNNSARARVARVNSYLPPPRPATETCPTCGSVVSLLYSLPYGVSGPHICSECLSRYERTGSVTA
jgi:biotin operon repressor